MTEPHVPAEIITRYDIEIKTPASPYAPREWQQGNDSYFGQFYRFDGFASVDDARDMISRINARIVRDYFEGWTASDGILIRDKDYRVIEVITISRVVS